MHQSGTHIFGGTQINRNLGWNSKFVIWLNRLHRYLPRHFICQESLHPTFWNITVNYGLTLYGYRQGHLYSTLGSIINWGWLYITYFVLSNQSFLTTDYQIFCKSSIYIYFPFACVYLYSPVIVKMCIYFNNISFSVKYVII